MIKLKVILLPIKFEQRENPRQKKKKKFFERVTMVPVPSHGGPTTRKQKVLGERLSLGSLLSTSEQLLIVS